MANFSALQIRLADLDRRITAASLRLYRHGAAHSDRAATLDQLYLHQQQQLRDETAQLATQGRGGGQL